jgi:hypothetical protein
MADALHADTYLILQGKRWPWSSLDEPVREFTVVGHRKSKPTSLRRDQVAIKVTLTVPVRAFEPFTAAALVNVPESLVVRPIEVQAVDPDTQ